MSKVLCKFDHKEIDDKDYIIEIVWIDDVLPIVEEIINGEKRQFNDLSYEDILNQVFPVPNTLALKRKTDDWNWHEMKENIEAYEKTRKIFAKSKFAKSTLGNPWIYYDELQKQVEENI
tara:strand:+ start:825 stop:1181 length:357 start_codon:yes stop_codon:yes gene_type:complete